MTFKNYFLCKIKNAFFLVLALVTSNFTECSLHFNYTRTSKNPFYPFFLLFILILRTSVKTLWIYFSKDSWSFNWWFSILSRLNISQFNINSAHTHTHTQKPEISQTVMAVSRSLFCSYCSKINYRVRSKAKTYSKWIQKKKWWAKDCIMTSSAFISRSNAPCVQMHSRFFAAGHFPGQ